MFTIPKIGDTGRIGVARFVRPISFKGLRTTYWLGLVDARESYGEPPPSELSSLSSSWLGFLTATQVLSGDQISFDVVAHPRLQTPWVTNVQPLLTYQDVATIVTRLLHSAGQHETALQLENMDIW